jgi:hypothetical protein
MWEPRRLTNLWDRFTFFLPFIIQLFIITLHLKLYLAKHRQIYEEGDTPLLLWDTGIKLVLPEPFILLQSIIKSMQRAADLHCPLWSRYWIRNISVQGICTHDSSVRCLRAESLWHPLTQFVPSCFIVHTVKGRVLQLLVLAHGPHDWITVWKWVVLFRADRPPLSSLRSLAYGLMACS